MIVSVIFGLGVFLLDRVVKALVLSNFYLGETRAFLPGVLQLTYVQNTGMAFGFLADYQWLPMALTPLIMIGLGALLWKNLFPCPVQRLALVAVMAGGLGNWVDRLLYGFVVDMFQPIFIRFAVFNVADMFITMGGAVFVAAYFLSEWRMMREKREAKTEAETEVETRPEPEAETKSTEPSGE